MAFYVLIVMPVFVPRTLPQRSADEAGSLTQDRRPRKRTAVNATGGLTLGSGADFVPAAASVLRCALCQVHSILLTNIQPAVCNLHFSPCLLLKIPAALQISFKNVAEEQQHLAGPIHRKAVARQQAENEQTARISKGKSAAQSAVVSSPVFPCQLSCAVSICRTLLQAVLCYGVLIWPLHRR